MEGSLNSLGFCTYHPQEKISLLCTKPKCHLSRLLCFKCNFLNTHPECKNNLIMIEDLESNKFEEPMKNWIKTDELMKILNSYKEKEGQNEDAANQEIFQYIDSKFDELEKIAINRINEIKENFKENLQGSLACYKQHFSLVNLRRILFDSKNCKQEETKKKLNSFFDFEPLEFPKIHNLSNLKLNQDKKEKTDKLIHILNGELDKLEKFKNKIFLEVFEISRFGEISSIWSYSKEKTDYITFSVDENILLEGISINALQNMETKGVFKILKGDSSDSEIIYEKNFFFENKEKKETCLLKLENIIEIKKNSKYTLTLSIPSGNSAQGKSGKTQICYKKPESYENIIFYFEVTKNKIQCNGTSVESGQFPKIHFSLIN